MPSLPYRGAAGPCITSTVSSNDVGSSDRSVWPSCGFAMRWPSKSKRVCEAPAPRTEAVALPYALALRTCTPARRSNRSATLYPPVRASAVESKRVTGAGRSCSAVGMRVAVTVRPGRSTCHAVVSGGALVSDEASGGNEWEGVAAVAWLPTVSMPHTSSATIH